MVFEGTSSIGDKVRIHDKDGVIRIGDGRGRVAAGDTAVLYSSSGNKEVVTLTQADVLSIYYGKEINISTEQQKTGLKEIFGFIVADDDKIRIADKDGDGKVSLGDSALLHSDRRIANRNPVVATLSQADVSALNAYTIVDLEHARDRIPEDSNTAFERGSDILYYADPSPAEGGLNRIVRVDTKTATGIGEDATVSFSTVDVSGSNPHSVDRVGDSDRFYVRTQGGNSISVVSFNGDTAEKTIDLGDLNPRSAGATNLKHNIQLVSMHNRPVISIIDTKTDTVLDTVGDINSSLPNMSNGHPLWLDEDHFGLLDRVNSNIKVFKVENNSGELSFRETDSVHLDSPAHIIHKTATVNSTEDLETFYVMGEGDPSDATNNPFVAKMRFDPVAGKLNSVATTSLSNSSDTVNGRTPIAHHGGTTPDGKHFFATNLDGTTYVIDTATMGIVKELQTGLGAGHVNFSKEENVAVVTNHNSTDISIIDLDTFDMKNIRISESEDHSNDRHILQLHNPLISNNGRHFLTMASHDGDFIKVDLRTKEVAADVHIGGVGEQTSS